MTKFEKELRKRHHILMTEVAKIEHLIVAFEKGAKRGAKRTGGRISAAGLLSESYRITPSLNQIPSIHAIRQFT